MIVEGVTRKSATSMNLYSESNKRAKGAVYRVLNLSIARYGATTVDFFDTEIFEGSA